MSWFSGKVSLGNFPDLAGAVNKFSESVKNIEKNFDTALGFEEKTESTSEASGLWPVISFTGNSTEESTLELKSSKDPTDENKDVTADISKESAVQKNTVHENDETPKAENGDEHTETAEQMDNITSGISKAECESQTMSTKPPEIASPNDEALSSINDSLQKKTSTNNIDDKMVGTSERSESLEVSSRAYVEVDQVDGRSDGSEETQNVIHIHENTDEPNTKEEIIEEQSSTVHAEVKMDNQDHYHSEPSFPGPPSPKEVESSREVFLPTVFLPNDPIETVSESFSHEKDMNILAFETDQETTNREVGIKDQEQFLSSPKKLLDSTDTLCELEKVKAEMKMMESALQGAARQAQAKADEIANMMNENEHLKSVIEDLKRKSNEAEIESLREEYHQRVATLERKIYALTKERDTIRREQNKKSDAAALLKEKDEIITQVMAEGEELSKKQAAQEATIRKLRAQIREHEEEKKGLVTKLQVEESKVESIKKDKTATEKLLQETIEKHQAELAVQKEYYTNALAAAKEAEELAEARANSEARTELESRLKEAEEREAMLVQALEELRQTLSRKEQQAVFKEDMFRRDIEDLQKRYQASERRCEELITQVPDSTRPLLRQIEAMQETTSRRAEAWAAVERSLNSRLQEAEAKAASAEERERSINERLSQTLSRINVLEAQISCLRAEQTQLSRSLEKERQRAAENRQEYLAAKEEADTQEGRANQLNEEIKELRRKHRQDLQDELIHRELLQQELEREKAARLDLERTTRVHTATSLSGQSPKARHHSVETGSLSRKVSSASSLGNMEESYFLQASLGSSDSSFSERTAGETTTINPYYIKSMTPSTFEASLRQKEGELASYMSRLASLESIRDSLAEELVKMTAQCEKLRAEAVMLPGVRAELEALRRRHSAALELMGERDEELEELRADIVDLKEMYREQVNLLVNKIQRLG